MTNKDLDIYVGSLISKHSLFSNEFYSLNYCDSSGDHSYQSDDDATNA